MYTGLFAVAENDAQLAAVLSHEVAHAIARHGAERLSQELALQTMLAVLGVTTGQRAYVELAAQAATLGVVLPYSRIQENEADEIGVRYMATAGYDPREALQLWRNFRALEVRRPPEFLSTHPLPETRIRRLEALMPEAMAICERQQRRQSRSGWRPGAARLASLRAPRSRPEGRLRCAGHWRLHFERVDPIDMGSHL